MDVQELAGEPAHIIRQTLFPASGISKDATMRAAALTYELLEYLRDCARGHLTDTTLPTPQAASDLIGQLKAATYTMSGLLHSLAEHQHFTAHREGLAVDDLSEIRDPARVATESGRALTGANTHLRQALAELETAHDHAARLRAQPQRSHQ